MEGSNPPLSIEYFLLDCISVGANFAGQYISGISQSDVLSAGPSATFYFFESGQLSSYIRAIYLFEVSGSSSGKTLNIALGLNYSFTSWFGISPELRLNVYDNFTSVSTNLLNLSFYF